MDVDAVTAGGTGIVGAIGYAIGAFAAVSLAISKSLGDKKNESVQVTFYRERAETAERKYAECWERMNAMSDQLSELKLQNAVMVEQLKTVRDENAELAAQVRKFMDAQK